MCATKLYTMRTPTEEHLHKSSELGSSDQKAPRNSKALSSFHSEHQLLSRQDGGYVRNPSVPDLLNVDSFPSAAQTEPRQFHTSSYSTRVSKERQPNFGLAVETSSSIPLAPHDTGGNFITPPSSTTRVQFKTPVWKSGTNDPNEVESPSVYKGGMTPARHRQGSMESLMRAAATVESDMDLNKTYQDKIATIIDLKNKISNTIRSWPIAKKSSVQEDSSGQRLSNIGESSSPILLDQISCENLTSLDEITGNLGNTVKELVDLKKRIRYLKESAAAMAQARSQPTSSERRVTLPPIETLTMNLPQKSSPGDFRFPPEQLASSSTAPAIAKQHNRSASIQAISGAGEQSGSSTYSIRANWPENLAGQGHRPTLSEPLIYRNRGSVGDSSQKAEYPNLKPASGPLGARPIIFASQGGLQSPSKVKRKVVKKRKKSLPEKPLQDYRRSLTHGLLLSEPTKRDEHPTTSCVHCNEKSTPEWRRGPYGNRTLCNACGLFYRKLIKKFGTKDANMLMRFKKQINPEDRRVPSLLNVPADFIANLNNDSSLDVEYNSIVGTSNSGNSGM